MATTSREKLDRMLGEKLVQHEGQHALFLHVSADDIDSLVVGLVTHANECPIISDGPECTCANVKIHIFEQLADA